MNQFVKKKTPSTEAAPITDLVTDSTTQLMGRQSKTKTFRRGNLAAGMLKRLLVACGDPPIRVVLPDGQEICSATDQRAVGTIEIRDERTIWALALDPLFQFGEAYANGRLKIHGDMAECLTAVYRVMDQRTSSNWQSLLSTLRRPYANSLKGSQQNIQHHYDIGNDFYKLWLDEQMIYTCAYFAKPNFTLEQAQRSKLDHVCRKLQLKPGMQVVEAGCGWGALAIHMAKYYGVHVTAFNISKEQVDWAKEYALQARLQNQVEFVKDDWRNIKGKYDRFVSVGMLEHVGVKNYPLLGQTIHSCLQPDGIGLIHTIGQNRPLPFNSWIERRIFPGAYAPTLKQMMDIFETADFSVLDVENLRLHYAETLRHWLQRFEDSADLVREQFDERFVRMWRMYLAGSEAAFESGFLQLFQVVFANKSSNNVPRTREHLYDSAHDPSARILKRQQADCLAAADNDWSQS